MASRVKRLMRRLESMGLKPDYSGWLVLALAGFFFAAATNTLAGWLYLISGILIALLAISIVVARQALRGLQVSRSLLPPVHMGDRLYVALTLKNPRPVPRGLIQIVDHSPSALETTQTPPSAAVEHLAGPGEHRWIYEATARRRGFYQWSQVTLRTAAPFGLLWRCRQVIAPAHVMVYPQVIPLGRCPLLDGAAGLGSQSLGQRPTAATTGLMRSLRPYRWGDPMRLVHWRSSARYGELRSRELEEPLGFQKITVALDTTQADWHPDHFEHAVIAAASLVQYALHHQLAVQLWTAATGFVGEPTAIMETLARVALAPPPKRYPPLSAPFIGLTASPTAGTSPVSVNPQTAQGRWLLWPQANSTAENARPAAVNLGAAPPLTAIAIDPEQPLGPQLQA